MKRATPLLAILSEHGISQYRLAKTLGFSPVTVWKWCHGLASPRAHNLVRIVAWLRTYEPGVTAEDLMGES